MKELNSHEVQVNDGSLDRVALHCDNLNNNLFACNVKSDVFVVENVILLSDEDFVVFKRDALSILVSAVDYSWDFARATKAAARTFPQVGTDFSVK